MSANKISKNFIKSRFQRISEFFPHLFFADPHEYWIQMLHTHNLSDISLAVLPAYPPVFHMPADLFFHILKPQPPSDSLLSVFLHPSQKWPKTILSEMNSHQNLPVIALTANAMVNAQNLAALEEKTGPVLAMYRSLKSLLRPYVEDNESSKKEVSSDDWITVLEQMHQCVEQFDMDGVDHAMETMDTFQTPDKLKDLMEQLRVCVADVEMEEIMKLTDTMVNLLQ